MKLEMLPKILRYYRKQQHISVQDVVLRLEEENVHVSPKTVYAWENGATQPDIGTVLVLCNIYQISNLQQLLGSSPDRAEDGIPVVLTEEERDILERYHGHPEMQEAVKKLLK